MTGGETPEGEDAHSMAASLAETSANTLPDVPTLHWQGA